MYYIKFPLNKINGFALNKINICCQNNLNKSNCYN